MINVLVLGHCYDQVLLALIHPRVKGMRLEIYRLAAVLKRPFVISTAALHVVHLGRAGVSGWQVREWYSKYSHDKILCG